MGVSVAGRRAAVPALASAGALSAHALGYSTATLLGAARAQVPHGHVVLLGWLGGVAAAVAVLLLAGSAARRGGCCTGLSLRSLLPAQLALYVWLETGERLLHGEPLTGLLSAPVLLGLLAQPLTAWTLLVLLASTTTVARRLLRRPQPVVVHAPAHRTARPRTRRRPLRVPLPRGSRAPPALA